MKSISRMVQIAGTAMLLGIALPVYAESAPVYDVDALPQQYDTQDVQQEDVPPPPPGQEGTFVPMQQQQAPSPRIAPPMSTNQRLQRVEQQINNMQTNDAAARMDSLQNQVQALHAQVEQLTHQLEQLQAQQKSMYADLDKRVSQPRAVESAPAIAPVTSKAGKTTLKPTAPAVVAPVPAVKPAALPPPDDVEEQSYKTAYNLIKAKKYNEAITTLQDMLKKYPSGQFASNAHYWLGELYGLTGKNDQALKEFTIMVASYPESPRAGDAQLKVGLLYATQSKWSDAKTAFKKVVKHYPGTAPAQLASEQLKQLKQAGH
ncbi:MAG: tol-pal system protein YbgF [Gammaproteobacteria bacterium]